MISVFNQVIFRLHIKFFKGVSTEVVEENTWDLFWNSCLSCPVNRFRMALVPRVNEKSVYVDAAVLYGVASLLEANGGFMF